MAVEDHRARNRSIGKNQFSFLFGKASLDPTVDSRRPTEGLKLNLKRYHNRERKKMAVDDRSTGPGQQVHQDFGKIIAYVRHRCGQGEGRHALDEDFGAGYSEWKVVFAGKCWERVGSSTVADFASTNRQDFRITEHLFRRQNLGLQQ